MRREAGACTADYVKVESMPFGIHASVNAYTLDGGRVERVVTVAAPLTLLRYVDEAIEDAKRWVVAEVNRMEAPLVLAAQRREAERWAMRQSMSPFACVACVEKLQRNLRERDPMRVPRSPEGINIDDHDDGDLHVYAYADDGEPVEERIRSWSPESVVLAAQERVAAEVNRRNALIQERRK